GTCRRRGCQIVPIFTQALPGIHISFTPLHYHTSIDTSPCQPGGGVGWDDKEHDMQRKILIGVAGGALALALAGGAVYAGPSIERSLVAAQATTPTAQPTNPSTQPGEAQPNSGARRGERGKAALLTAALIKASADVTGTQPKDVLAALRDGKSLAQYAKDHGKTDTDVIQA